MDQASGLYRWRTLLILSGVAAILVTTINFDAIRISRHVSERGLIEKIIEARLNEAAKASAVNPAAAFEAAENEIASLQLVAFPLGWSGDMPGRGGYSQWLFFKLAGLLASVLAIMLGAPFLFDTLNRFMIVRFVVKPFDQM